MNKECKNVIKETVPFYRSTDLDKFDAECNAFIYQDEFNRICILPANGGILVSDIKFFDGEWAINHG